MNSHQQTDLIIDEQIQSPSSEERMDTASESYRSQDTPNSLSSEFEDRDVNHELNMSSANDTCQESPIGVLRLSHPENIDNMKNVTSKFKEEINNSLINKMSLLTIESPMANRPKNLGLSPPKFSLTSTITTDHPLKGLGSPDENFPDLIPKKTLKVDEDKDLSLSSIEDERPNETSGFFSPQRNTSKNNLYYSDNFVTADSHILNDLSSEIIPPDVARVEQKKRKIIPQLNDKSLKDSSTPIRTGDKFHGLDISEKEEFNIAAKWQVSPCHTRTIPNFDLPIEMSSSIAVRNELGSPDVISTSTQDDKSSYRATLDPYTCSVALKHKSHNITLDSTGTQRRKIQLPPDNDSCDSGSINSLECDDEDVGPEVIRDDNELKDNDEQGRPPSEPSSKTLSECSDLIPEYSLEDELRDERSWLTVQRNGTNNTLCDMKVIEPYKRVLSHGGYDSSGAAIIVFAACHLPDASRTDYRYVMDNLFLYVMWTLERLVTDEYIVVYLHGSMDRRGLPSFHWLHDCYKLIDRRLRKSLKHLYLVHPTFWLKSLVVITKPFVSSKFFRKLTYVKSLHDLYQKVNVEPNAIPEAVKHYDAIRR